MRQFPAALLALIAVAIGAGCTPGTGGIGAEGDTTNGKRLFQERCASCHGLADAGSRSTVGPNLDDAFAGVRQQGFKEGTIREIVTDQIKYAVEPMPQNLVTGSDADDVAAYVASVAGKEGFSEAAGAAGGTTGGGGQADGKSLFASAGCGSCHTLAAAGASGTIGPNLDESKPTLELAVDRITNGKAPMPPFKSQLSEAEIRALADFVVQSVG